MTVRVLFFAFLRERLHRTGEKITLKDDATVGDLWDVLCTTHAPLKDHYSSISFAVNQEYVPRDHPLHEGDEVALIPPVSGG